MDENKEKNLDGVQNEDERLREELEELARTFQEELDKAKAQEDSLTENESDEQSQELIQDLEDIEETQEEEEPFTEAELCECCGENRRGTKKNPDSSYCYECEKALRHYPFELLNLIVPMILAAFCIYGAMVFSGYTGIYTTAELADKYAKQNKLYTANTAYEMAVEEMTSKKVNGEMIYKRMLENGDKAGVASDSIKTADIFKEWEIKLPHLKSVYNMHLEALEMDATQYAIQDIFYKYDSEDVADVDFEKIIEEIEALNEKTAKAMPLYDGETEEEIETTAVFNIKIKNYSRPMLLYFEFYIASVCEKDYETQIKYLEKIKEEYPEKTWLYGAFLGDLYNKTGKDITELYKTMKSVNAEDTGADVVKATSLRIKGKYDEAIELCNEFIEKEDAYSYEFNRQKAICLLLKGDEKSAYDAAYEAYSENTIPLTVNVLLACSVLTNNTEAYKELENLYVSSEMTVPQEILDLKDGKTTVKEIFTKGDFDIA